MLNISTNSRLSQLSNTQRSQMRSELISLFQNQYPRCRRIKVKYGPNHSVWAHAICGTRRLYAVAYSVLRA